VQNSAKIDDFVYAIEDILLQRCSRAFDPAMQRLLYRPRSVLLDLRINDLTRHEVATRLGLSLRSVDTDLRQMLDYCVAEKAKALCS
jgi:DNA-directed RNA polymerase specialized sigma24 family protein